jgi:hypothetical protein
MIINKFGCRINLQKVALLERQDLKFKNQVLEFIPVLKKRNLCPSIKKVIKLKKEQLLMFIL